MKDKNEIRIREPLHGDLCLNIHLFSPLHYHPEYVSITSLRLRLQSAVVEVRCGAYFKFHLSGYFHIFAPFFMTVNLAIVRLLAQVGP